MTLDRPPAMRSWSCCQRLVIASRGDYEWSRQIVNTYDLSKRCHEILFSPVFGMIEPVEIVKWILEDDLDVRFQLQLHKFIWPPDEKGV